MNDSFIILINGTHLNAHKRTKGEQSKVLRKFFTKSEISDILASIVGLSGPFYSRMQGSYFVLRPYEVPT